MYYDLSKIISYQSFLNFLIGARGVGKTYSVTKFVINQFIKKGEEFAYIRRYKTELQKSAPKFFNAVKVNNEFPKHKLETKGEKFYIDDKIAGYNMSLSTAQNMKSSNFPNVKYIIFDEFIIEASGGGHYLPNEVETFLSLVESIARMRDVRVFLLANAVTVTNPYFLYFDLSLPYNNDVKTFKDNLILVQYISNEAYINAKKDTKFGKLVAGTEYSAYAIDNEFRLDDNSFIEKKTGTSRLNFNIKFNEQIFGVWFDYNISKIFISNDFNNNVNTFACTTDDMKPNTMLLSIAKEYHGWRVFIKNYKLGNVYYENQKIKNLTKQFMRLLIS